MNPKTKQFLLGFVTAILLMLAIEFMRDRAGTERAFREGFDATSGSSTPRP